MSIRDEALNRGLYNNEEFSLYDRFTHSLSKSSATNLALSAVVGYFRSSGYFPLRESLKPLRKMRVLVGIDADKLSSDWYRRGREERDRRLRLQITSDIVKDIEDARYRPEIEAGVKAFVEDILSGRLEMRAYDKRTVHAKFYLFLPEDWEMGLGNGWMVTGSSNFTAPGLGVHKEYARSNYELNVELRQDNQIAFAKAEFERLWNDSTEVIPAEMVRAIQTQTFLNQSAGPRDLYFKFLQQVFQDEVDYDSQSIETILPVGYKRLTYQIDAVNEGMRLLNRHNGFFLADVVGLGKTIVGTLLIYCQLRELDRKAKVLIVAPPVLVDTWDRTVEDFRLKRDRIDILSSGSLHKIARPEDYGLIVIDEAHNFRNHKTGKYELLQALCRGRGAFGRKKVILVSATPLNNEPLEILNLLALFQDVYSSTLAVADLKEFFVDKQNRYEELKESHVTAQEAEAGTRTIYQEIRDEVLSHVIIRRTRSDLTNHQEYSLDLQAQHIRFPQVQLPQALGYFVDTDLDALFERSLNLFSGGRITYAYHKHLSYLTGAAAEKFDTRANTYAQLGGLLTRLFLKRLDSSFHAFLESLKRFRSGIVSHLKMLEENNFIIASSVDVQEYVNNDDAEGLAAELSRNRDQDPSITSVSRADFKPEFVEHLRSDLVLVDAMIAEWTPWADPEHDPKFEAFVKEIDHNFLKIGKNPGQRVVVFTESEDTAHDLHKALDREDALCISAANRSDFEEVLRVNFNANTPSAEQRDEYRILITTDVLAEGISLHRANTIVNYDTPWNSVRLFQRIGRVNRVGSTAEKIYIYNFFPQPRVDDVIELQKKARVKLQSFHSAFGEDAAIYSPHEQVTSFGLFNALGDDPTDPASNPRLDLLMELREFKKNSPAEYERIERLPLGVRGTRVGVPEALVFLRTSARESYYRVTEEPKLVSLIEAAAFLKTEGPSAGEKAEWGRWLAPARDLFLHTEEIRKKELRRVKTLSRPQGEAIVYLNGFLDTLEGEWGLADAERPLFALVVDRIQRGGAENKFVKAVTESAKNSRAAKLQVRPQIDHLVRLMTDYGYDKELVRTQEQLEMEWEAEEPLVVMALAQGEAAHG